MTMDWGGIQGIFTLAESDPSLIYLDQPGSSNNVIISSGYPTQMVGDGIYDISSMHPPGPDRLLFVDEHGNLHESYPDIGILSHNMGMEDDGEIPPHALDHMYAKKPREPGSEQAAKPRRRSKKKEQVVEQPYIIPEPIPQTPKINIIRQRLPSSVYKSLSPSRPKILQGGSPIKGISPVKGGNESPSPRKDVVTRLNFSSGGRTIKKEKEDPNFTQQTIYAPFGDDHVKNTVPKGLGFGNGSKLMKESHLLARTVKPFGSKVNSNSILMEDLHKQVGETEYEEEMLFDFGIAEDEDEVNRCDLSSEEFNDVVFGECEFGSSLEPYSMTTQSSNKGLSSSRLPNNASSQRFFKKTGLSTAATLSSGMSDDDDSNQIMVPMGNRRKSRDWDSIEKVEAKIHDVSQTQVEERDVGVTVIDSFNSDSDKSTDPLVVVSAENSDSQDPLLLTPEDFRIKEEPPSESCLHGSIRTDPIERSDSKSFSIAFKESKDCKAVHHKVKITENTNLSNSTKSSVIPPKQTPEPTRRSIRAVRAPARLEDIDDGPAIKRKRR